MLNTLYPPTSSSRPTTKLTPEILKRQRDTFFRYIQAVERRGPDVLHPLIKQNTNPGDENGWSRVRQVLDSYLRVATTLIDECMQITCVEEFIAAPEAEQNWKKRSDRKADSGISFGSSDNPVDAEQDERKRSPDRDSTGESPPTKKQYSTLARVAHEFRKLRSLRRTATTSTKSFDAEKMNDSRCVSRADTVRMDGQESLAPQKEATKGLRRLRSLADLRSPSRTAGTGPNDPAVPAMPTAVSQSFG